MEPKKIKVDLKMFNAVKTLIAGGATIAECANYMGICSATVKYIKAAENYEEYKNIIAAVNIRKRERQAAKKAADAAPTPVVPAPAQAPAPEPVKPTQIVDHKYDVTVQTTHYMSQKLDKIEELLKGISQKLGFICEDLYGSKEEA